MTDTTTAPPVATGPTVPPPQRPKRRLGDVIFSRLSSGSGFLILIILAAVAAFLLVQAFPALVSSPEVLKTKGYGEFWSWVLPFAFGTVWSSLWALILAVPVSIGIALFITHYAPRRLARTLGYIIDLLAAVPSVVFGLWGTMTLAPATQPVYQWLNTYLGFIPLFGGEASGTGRTLLTAAIVLAVMILPIITSLCREVFLQTPRLHEEAALALGATRWETIKLAVLPYGRAGTVAAVMLGLGRALGETMAVAMVLSGNQVINFRLLTSDNPNTVAAMIAQNFPEASGIRINELIAAGLVLFVITLIINSIARLIISRYSEFSGAN
ncbi:MAG: phosphate ABC transporter permease subunit PstC [Propionibacteriaceae bacterium]|nr:phosphate ABC transporter permease subunit PstC [Micropruina sp.]HBX80991.1 phosphate ABC transporter permease subunit PstC [Propionibacteriaceae bacterium]HBY21986.1 phosphate ABC transporter permease subunit PstC [Propionibacteriaceae bacterium]